MNCQYLVKCYFFFFTFTILRTINKQRGFETKLFGEISTHIPYLYLWCAILN